MLLEELDVVQQLLLVASQGDAQGRQVSGPGVDQILASFSKIPDTPSPGA